MTNLGKWQADDPGHWTIFMDNPDVAVDGLGGDETRPTFPPGDFRRKGQRPPREGGKVSTSERGQR